MGELSSNQTLYKRTQNILNKFQQQNKLFSQAHLMVGHQLAIVES